MDHEYAYEFPRWQMRKGKLFAVRRRCNPPGDYNLLKGNCPFNTGKLSKAA